MRMPLLVQMKKREASFLYMTKMRSIVYNNKKNTTYKYFFDQRIAQAKMKSLKLTSLITGQQEYIFRTTYK